MPQRARRTRRIRAGARSQNLKSELAVRAIGRCFVANPANSSNLESATLRHLHAIASHLRIMEVIRNLEAA